jgi:hypothetical protein
MSSSSEVSVGVSFGGIIAVVLSYALNHSGW